MKAMNIRKNDRVRLINAVKPRWSIHEVPVGTEAVVCKVTRDGVIHCVPDSDDFYGNPVVVNPCQVVKIDRKENKPEVGDLFYCSWGYDQVNIDFYQVTNVLNKMVEVRSIEGTRQYEGPMNGKTCPVPNEFTSEPRRFLLKYSVRGCPFFKPASYSVARQCRADSEFNFSEWA